MEIPGGKSKDIFIRMDKDMNFDLLEVRYTARFQSGEDVSPADASGGKFHYGDFNLGTNKPLTMPQNVFRQYQSHPVDLPTPWHEMVQVSLLIRSGVERPLYGGMGRIGRGAAAFPQDEPISISALQGVDDGKNMIRTPFLIAKEAVVLVRVKNNFDATAAGGSDPGSMFIDGCLFGYKTAY